MYFCSLPKEMEVLLHFYLFFLPSSFFQRLSLVSSFFCSFPQTTLFFIRFVCSLSLLWEGARIGPIQQPFLLLCCPALLYFQMLFRSHCNFWLTPSNAHPSFARPVHPCCCILQLQLSINTLLRHSCSLLVQWSKTENYKTACPGAHTSYGLYLLWPKQEHRLVKYDFEMFIKSEQVFNEK